MLLAPGPVALNSHGSLEGPQALNESARALHGFVRVLYVSICSYRDTS